MRIKLIGLVSMIIILVCGILVRDFFTVKGSVNFVMDSTNFMNTQVMRSAKTAVAVSCMYNTS